MSDPADERLSPGTELELNRRYRIDAFLGAGGFAQVYRATELGIDRAVALKLLDVGPRIRKSHRERFFREAQAAARIAHPDVVTILEHGVAPDGRPYIAQEFLDGRDLADELDHHGPVDPARALPLFARAIDALAAAHEAGVVHRDLKPANLFLDRPGTRRERLCILDFGVACFHEQPDTRLTATGGFLGTPRYMAPEYIESRETSPAMDVYQMGLVLAETLTGRPAVDGENAYNCMVAHVNGQLSLPRWLRQSPAGPVVLAALALDPAERPSAAELSERVAEIDVDAVVERARAAAGDAALQSTDPKPARDAPTDPSPPPYAEVWSAAPAPRAVSGEVGHAVTIEGELIEPPPLPPAARGPRTQSIGLTAMIDPSIGPDTVLRFDRSLTPTPSPESLPPRTDTLATTPRPTRDDIYRRRAMWAGLVVVVAAAIAVLPMLRPAPDPPTLPEMTLDPPTETAQPATPPPATPSPATPSPATPSPATPSPATIAPADLRPAPAEGPSPPSGPVAGADSPPASDPRSAAEPRPAIDPAPARPDTARPAAPRPTPRPVAAKRPTPAEATPPAADPATSPTSSELLNWSRRMAGDGEQAQ